MMMIRKIVIRVKATAITTRTVLLLGVSVSKADLRKYDYICLTLKLVHAVCEQESKVTRNSVAGREQK